MGTGASIACKIGNRGDILGECACATGITTPIKFAIKRKPNNCSTSV